MNEKFVGQESVLRWFREDFRNNQETKRELGINATVQDDNCIDYIILWSQFFVLANYKEFIVLIDELAIFVIRLIVSLDRMIMKKFL